MRCVDCGQQKPIHARGLCNTCYCRRKRTRSLAETPQITIPDLPGERWIEIPGHDGWWLSTAARIKSTRSSKHKILKPWLLNGVWGIASTNGEGVFLLHTKMVELLLPGESGDIIFRDGDRKNPALSNLEVDTLQRRKERAIEMAEQSASSWGPAFAAFWRGDRSALDDFYLNMRLYLCKMVTIKLSKWRRDWMDVDDIAHSVLVAAFFSIANARLISLDTITTYLLTIADRIIHTNRKYYSDLVQLDLDSEGERVTVLDKYGYLSPSAETMAWAKEEILYRNAAANSLPHSAV